MENSESVRLTRQKRTMIFGDLIVSGIATSILSTAMTTALPSLMEDFGVSTDIGQWATSGYSLAMGMVMPLTAFLITRFPTKKLYMTAIGGFIIGLLCSIFAGNFWLMMAGRVLQACGNGVLVSAAQVIILTVYPAEKKGTMMGTYGLATTAAPIIAPTVAGLLIGVVTCICFIIRQCSLEKPFLDVKILGRRDYAVSVLSSMVLYLVMMGSSVMMPLLTWGTSNVDPKKVADASSLLTAFRTIAGFIGSAVFVGIMTVVSNGSAAVYGEDALIHGMNISFFWMAVGSLALLMIAVLGVRDGERQRE